jgi:hypothetical protein
MLYNLEHQLHNTNDVPVTLNRYYFMVDLLRVFEDRAFADSVTWTRGIAEIFRKRVT